MSHDTANAASVKGVPSAQACIRIACYLDGTIIDIMVCAHDGRPTTRKLPSTPEEYPDGVAKGILALFAEAGGEPGSFAEVRRGCSVATNIILKGRGGPTALVTVNRRFDAMRAVGAWMKNVDALPKRRVIGVPRSQLAVDTSGRN